MKRVFDWFFGGWWWVISALLLVMIVSLICFWLADLIGVNERIGYLAAAIIVTTLSGPIDKQRKRDKPQ